VRTRSIRHRLSNLAELSNARAQEAPRRAGRSRADLQGSWDDQRYALARESQVATGATIIWTVKGTGCVAWILVRDK
jgi:hypothetical protein